MDPKNKKSDRMNRSPKDSKDKKRPEKKDNPPQKKRGGGARGDDDDDVDSRGNLRGLIAYSSDSESLISEESPRNKRGFKPRKAAVKASKEIKKKLIKEQKKRPTVVVSDSEEDEDYELESPTTSLEEAEEDEEEEDEDEDEEEEDEEDEDEDEDAPKNRILLNFGFGEEEIDERMIPKRYKIKKEPEIVQKFFKLMTEPIDTETIDDHIDQFKGLKDDEQRRMITALESRPKAKDQPTMFNILNMKTSLRFRHTFLQSITACRHWIRAVASISRHATGWRRLWLFHLEHVRKCR